jgi:glycyl-tRNA synthetase alpha chain
MLTLQEIILRLEEFWAERGCVVLQPYNSEVGAGTFNPATFFRVLGPEPWNTVYVELSRRPKDGRYAENPNRVQQFHQLQVILKPSPTEVQEMYLDSLRALGIPVEKHDLRFVEDDWESPTLGAWGVGWQVWLDGQEITQFTYFQQTGGLDLDPVSCEITYGLDRIAMVVQDVDSMFDVRWNEDVTWGEIYKDFEHDFCVFNFDEADVDFHFELFKKYEAEAERLLEKGLLYPGYDSVIKASHVFNILDARGALSVSERNSYILRVRKIARKAALLFVKRREEMGYPLLKEET